jgi:hypothetical protein
MRPERSRAFPSLPLFLFGSQIYETGPGLVSGGHFNNPRHLTKFGCEMWPFAPENSRNVASRERPDSFSK